MSIKNKVLATLVLVVSIMTTARAEFQVPGSIVIQLYNQTSQHLILTPIYNINDCVEKNFNTPIKLAPNAVENLEGYVSVCQSYNIMFAIAFKVKVASSSELPGGNFAFLCSSKTLKCSLSQTAFPIKLPDNSAIKLTPLLHPQAPNLFLLRFTDK